MEPKTFFANERTFLQWLNAAVLVGGIGIGIHNSKSNRNSGDFDEGSLLVMVAIAIALYAIVIYARRMRAIENKVGSGYADYFGPFWITFAIVLAVIIAAV